MVSLCFCLIFTLSKIVKSFFIKSKQSFPNVSTITFAVAAPIPLKDALDKYLIAPSSSFLLHLTATALFAASFSPTTKI